MILKLFIMWLTLGQRLFLLILFGIANLSTSSDLGGDKYSEHRDHYVDPSGNFHSRGRGTHPSPELQHPCKRPKYGGGTQEYTTKLFISNSYMCISHGYSSFFSFSLWGAAYWANFCQSVLPFVSKKQVPSHHLTLEETPEIIPKDS